MAQALLGDGPRLLNFQVTKVESPRQRIYASNS